MFQALCLAILTYFIPICALRLQPNLSEDSEDAKPSKPQVYHDPAAGMNHHSYDKICSTATRNHPESLAKTLIPKDLSFNVTAWTKEYSEAMETKNVEILRKLKNQGEGYEMNPEMGETWFDFIQIKTHMIQALEKDMGVDELLRSGRNLLDIGTGHGFLSAYFAGRYGLDVVGYDIPNSYQCKELMATPLTVNFFDGEKIPESAQSYDAVSFMSVLHHAGARTPKLLQQAASIAKTWILVMEDLETGAENVHRRNEDHDPNGIFRNDSQWKELFEQHCRGFELVKEGHNGLRVDENTGFIIGVVPRYPNDTQSFQKWYTLKRIAT